MSDGGLAQLVRAPASHAGGRRFESAIVHHVAADCISFAATFYASHEKSLLTHSVAAPPKIAIADVGLRFCFSNLAVDP